MLRSSVFRSPEMWLSQLLVWGSWIWRHPLANLFRILETVSELPFRNCSTIMGPKVGDTRMYLPLEVLCSVIGVTGLMDESCIGCSMDEDVCV